MKLPSNPLQPPFKQRNLMTKSSFISHCKSFGVKTSVEELEFFEQEGLFFPALRIHRGFIPMRKAKIYIESEKKWDWRFFNESEEDRFKIEEILPETFYSSGNISLGRDGDFDFYLENKMFEFPVKSKFTPHLERPKWKAEFSTNKDDLGWPFVDLYNRHQLFTLSLLQKSFVLKIKNQDLYKTTESWEKLQMKVAAFYSKDELYPYVKKKISNNYNFIRLYEDIEDLARELNKEIDSFYKHATAALKIDHGEALVDLRHHEKVIRPEFKQSAEKILKDNKYTKDDLHYLMNEVLGWGTFGVGRESHKRRAYLNSLDENLLIRGEEPYKIAHYFAWFLWLLGEEFATINQLILRTENPICEVCHRPFKKRWPDQKTCASEDCKKEHRNKLKREKRKTGEYD